MTEGKPLDIHCGNCMQVIIPADRMKSLLNWRNGSNYGLFVPHVQTIIILNADLICPNCGRMVYFRINEQKLNMLLRNIIE